MVSCQILGIGGSPEAAAPPQYPIVLVHGIAVHDRGGMLQFWGDIPVRLQENEIKVFLGNTDAWGSVESNAEILRDTIEKVLKSTGSEKVNIIAHSKGGIDSRFLIWKHDFGDKVASLTTISTPHHGSEIADLISKQDIIDTKIAREALNLLGDLYGDMNPNMYSVCYELTTENMHEFNKVVFVDPRVFYQSLYTTMRNPLDDLMFFYSYRYLRQVAGNNDGVVSERSSIWGNNVQKLKDGISHAEIVDIKKRRISGVSIPDIYMNVVNDLSKRGF